MHCCLELLFVLRQEPFQLVAQQKPILFRVRTALKNVTNLKLDC